MPQHNPKENPTNIPWIGKGYDTRKIQDYLGHRQIQHPVRYTKLAPGQFEAMWD